MLASSSPSWFGNLVEAISQLTRTSGQSKSPDGISKEVSQYIPDSFTLSELLALVNGYLSSSTQGAKAITITHYNVILGILASLSSPAGKQRLILEKKTSNDGRDIEATAAKELAVILAKGISPIENHGTGSGGEDTDMLSEEEDEETQRKKNYNDLAQRCRFLAGRAIPAIHELLTCSMTSNSTTQTIPPNLEEVFLTLTAFTSRDESPTQESNEERENKWTNPEIANQAERLLLDEKLPLQPGSSTRDQFITSGILERYLRPLFSKTKRPTAITASGRKAAYSDDDNDESGLPDDSWVTKPWKFTDHRAIPVFAWAVDEADEQLITKNWPLFIPVLLTLVDDPTTNIRARGITILSKFLAKFPTKLLLETGLAQVFEDAVFPTLSYLPSLTPEKESVRLLGPAFEALRLLARKQSASFSTFEASVKNVTPEGAKTTSKERENKLLDRVLREGVFPAYFHAKEHMSIVEVLCQQTVLVLQQMGIHAVKHLKDLIPMISSIMTTPFAPLSPTTLLASIKTLQATIATCWPRLTSSSSSSSSSSPWQDEIIHSLVTCWLNVHDFEQEDQKNNQTASSTTPRNSIAEIKQQLTISASAMSAVLKTRTAAEEGTASQATSDHHPQIKETDPLGELVSPLVSKEPLLAGLFCQKKKNTSSS